MRLINLTPHSVTICGVTIPPEPESARCREIIETRGTVEINGTCVPLISKHFGEVTGLPAPCAGVMYITSAVVAQAAWFAGRRDVVCPGELARDDQGRVVGATSLCVAP